MDSYRRAWEQIVKPPRFSYSEDFDFFIPEEVEGVQIEKTSFSFLASDGKTELSASLVAPVGRTPSTLLIYLHTFSGNKLEGRFLLPYVQPSMGLVLFDSFGCGNAGGEYVSLGVRERDDLSLLLAELHRRTGFARALLFGRSMGAVTILHYLAKFHAFPMAKSAKPIPPAPFEIAGVALDSPFTDLYRLVHERIVDGGQSSWLASLMLVPVTASLKNAFGFDLFAENKPLDLVARVRAPAIFLIGDKDDLVNQAEFRKMFERYGTRAKRLEVMLETTHAQERHERYLHTSLEFLFGSLRACEARSLGDLHRPLHAEPPRPFSVVELSFSARDKSPPTLQEKSSPTPQEKPPSPSQEKPPSSSQEKSPSSAREKSPPALQEKPHSPSPSQEKPLSSTQEKPSSSTQEKNSSLPIETTETAPRGGLTRVRSCSLVAGPKGPAGRRSGSLSSL